jgi:hypothetical protein
MTSDELVRMTTSPGGIEGTTESQRTQAKKLLESRRKKSTQATSGSIATNLKKAGATNEQLKQVTDDFGKFRNEDPGYSRPIYDSNQDRRISSLPDYEAFKKYQSTIPNNQLRVSASVIVPRRLADGTVINFSSPLQAEDYDNYLKSIGKPPTTSVGEMGRLDTLTPQKLN